MKPNHYWALLKQETVLILVRSVIPATFGLQIWVFAGLDRSSSSNTSIGLLLLPIFGALSILLCYAYVFQSGLFAFGRPDKGYGRTLEFPFSRAICRNSL